MFLKCEIGKISNKNFFSRLRLYLGSLRQTKQKYQITESSVKKKKKNAKWGNNIDKSSIPWTLKSVPKISRFFYRGHSRHQFFTPLSSSPTPITPNSRQTHALHNLPPQKKKKNPNIKITSTSYRTRSTKTNTDHREAFVVKYSGYLQPRIFLLLEAHKNFFISRQHKGWKIHLIWIYFFIVISNRRGTVFKWQLFAVRVYS